MQHAGQLKLAHAPVTLKLPELNALIPCMVQQLCDFYASIWASKSCENEAEKWNSSSLLAATPLPQIFSILLFQRFNEANHLQKI